MSSKIAPTMAMAALAGSTVHSDMKIAAAIATIARKVTAAASAHINSAAPKLKIRRRALLVCVWAILLAFSNKCVIIVFVAVDINGFSNNSRTKSFLEKLSLLFEDVDCLALFFVI